MNVYLDPEAFQKRYKLPASRARRWPQQLIDRLNARAYVMEREAGPTGLVFSLLPVPIPDGWMVTRISPSFLWAIRLRDSRERGLLRLLSTILTTIRDELDAKLGGANDQPDAA